MYMEGCTAPKFETATLHSAVVELVALKGAKIQYVTVQNWSSNVFNLVTKRGLATRTPKSSGSTATSAAV
jgi:Fe-S cluster assembly protein SufB